MRRCDELTLEEYHPKNTKGKKKTWRHLTFIIDFVKRNWHVTQLGFLYVTYMDSEVNQLY